MRKSKSNQFRNINSIGIGITNKCNFECPHCYSRALPVKSLALSDISKILDYFPNVKKVNFGTGESVLNPEMISITNFFKERGIEMALTTNGTTVAQLSDEHLRWFKDVDISLDFPIAKLHNQWRSEGAFEKAIKGLARCKELGMNTCIALCLMNINYTYLAKFRNILDKFKVGLRINIYKPTPTDKFLLNYSQFWKSIELLAKNFLLISSSEPVLSILTDTKIKGGSPCGDNSVRIHPDGTITPCVFLAGQQIDISEFREFKKRIPDFCQKCNYLEQCQGGCLARRILRNRLDQPDEYCPFYYETEKPKITFQRSKTAKSDFIHSSYLCTIIVE